MASVARLCSMLLVAAMIFPACVRQSDHGLSEPVGGVWTDPIDASPPVDARTDCRDITDCELECDHGSILFSETPEQTGDCKVECYRKLPEQHALPLCE